MLALSSIERILVSFRLESWAAATLTVMPDANLILYEKQAYLQKGQGQPISKKAKTKQSFWSQMTHVSAVKTTLVRPQMKIALGWSLIGHAKCMWSA